MKIFIFIFALAILVFVPFYLKAGVKDLTKFAEEGRLEEIKKEISKGYNINKKHGRFDITLLMAAAYNGHFELVQYLLDHGAITEFTNAKSKTTALSYAAEQSNSKIVKLLIDRGANINTRDYQGQTPLMKAIIFGQKENAKILIENGADLELQDNEGATAYSYSIVAKQNEIEQMLLDHGAVKNNKRPVYGIF